MYIVVVVVVAPLPVLVRAEPGRVPDLAAEQAPGIDLTAGGGVPIGSRVVQAVRLGRARAGVPLWGTGTSTMTRRRCRSALLLWWWTPGTLGRGGRPSRVIVERDGWAHATGSHAGGSPHGPGVRVQDVLQVPGALQAPDHGLVAELGGRAPIHPHLDDVRLAGGAQAAVVADDDGDVGGAPFRPRQVERGATRAALGEQALRRPATTQAHAGRAARRAAMDRRGHAPSQPAAILAALQARPDVGFAGAERAERVRRAALDVLLTGRTGSDSESARACSARTIRMGWKAQSGHRWSSTALHVPYWGRRYAALQAPHATYRGKVPPSRSIIAPLHRPQRENAPATSRPWPAASAGARRCDRADAMRFFCEVTMANTWTASVRVCSPPTGTTRYPFHFGQVAIEDVPRRRLALGDARQVALHHGAQARRAQVVEAQRVVRRDERQAQVGRGEPAVRPFDRVLAFLHPNVSERPSSSSADAAGPQSSRCAGRSSRPSQSHSGPSASGRVSTGAPHTRRDMQRTRPMSSASDRC